jgi:hypothetical protein
VAARSAGAAATALPEPQPADATSTDNEVSTSRAEGAMSGLSPRSAQPFNPAQVYGGWLGRSFGRYRSILLRRHGCIT